MESAITLEERSIAEPSADCISFKNETKVAVVVTSRIISKVVFTRRCALAYIVDVREALATEARHFVGRTEIEID